MSTEPFFARLPATSANLGPGFDAVGLAMSLFLTVRAEPSPAFAITATGRNADLCARLDNNLILMTYTEVFGHLGLLPPPISIHLENEIPLGMGCGSSAAALLAGVLLANHFGDLRWTPQQILDEACQREGHPDNVAACFHGGFTVSRMTDSQTAVTASLGHHLPWHLTLALPHTSLPTREARALLPETYRRHDVVLNIGSTALLVAAFALGRADLLRHAMHDRIHQPYREQVCPLLPRLLPLANRPDIAGIALSGAGPAILLISEQPLSPDLRDALTSASGLPAPELLTTSIAPGISLNSPTCNEGNVT